MLVGFHLFFVIFSLPRWMSMRWMWVYMIEPRTLSCLFSLYLRTRMYVWFRFSSSFATVYFFHVHFGPSRVYFPHGRLGVY
jgi:hypothetical protein